MLKPLAISTTSAFLFHACLTAQTNKHVHGVLKSQFCTFTWCNNGRARLPAVSFDTSAAPCDCFQHHGDSQVVILTLVSDFIKSLTVSTKLIHEFPESG